MIESDRFLLNGMYRSMRSVADYCGVDCARELVRVFGGCRLWIPQRWREDHDIGRIGERHARSLIDAYGNQAIDVPRRLLTSAGVAHVIAEMTASGMPQRDIARAMNMSQRSVSRIQHSGLIASTSTVKIRRMVDPRQIDLEDWLK